MKGSPTFDDSGIRHLLYAFAWCFISLIPTLFMGVRLEGSHFRRCADFFTGSKHALAAIMETT